MTTPNRRGFLRSAAVAAGALTLSPLSAVAADEPVGFTLPKLPYAYDALEPYIDKLTMEIHHDKHHAAYVKNLNALLKNRPDLLKMSITVLMRDAMARIPEQKIRQGVINNGGGHLNHTLFWQMMAPPRKGSEPKGDLLKGLEASFGSLDRFKSTFTDAAMMRFGSGWAWLTAKAGKLEVMSSANQDPPVLTGNEPLLGIDVWEHAYYLKYQNRRADYVKAWWNVVNWDYVAERYQRTMRG
jgi:superoxide dismutase, Fe-Mn family